MIDERNNSLWPGWETVRLIGRGSFGAVYEIQRDMLGEKEKAALKIITIPQNDSDIKELYSEGYDEESVTSTFKEHLKSIVAEYTLMRKLNGNSNVVNCDDVRYVQHDDGIGWDIFIKMELLTPLTDALPPVIPEELVIRIGRDLCRALVQCRQLGIIHRDIKPQNIFVSRLGDYKLGDFGAAKVMERTTSGTKVGTYRYMAPEVYNNQPYGAGADIYSLGLVLYWLLNERRLPFLPLPPEKIRAGMEEEARLRRFRGDVIPEPLHGSTRLKQIVLKACAFDPKDRYRSAEDMLRALENPDSEEPAHGAGSSADAAEGTVGSGTIRAFSGKGGQTPGKSEQNDGAKRKTRQAMIIGAAAVLTLTIVTLLLKPRTGVPAAPDSGYAAAETEMPAGTQAPTVTPEPSQAALQPVPTDPPTPVPTDPPTPVPTAPPTLPPTAPPREEKLTASVSPDPPTDGRIYFSSASATSEYVEEGVVYSAGNVIKEKSPYPWAEGVRGWGDGEKLSLYFDETKSLSALSLRLGFAHTDELFEKNNRPSRLRFSFSDGSSVECDFRDWNQEFYVYLSRPVETWYVEITVLAVYSGTDNDTCIAAVRAYGD